MNTSDKFDEIYDSLNNVFKDFLISNLEENKISLENALSQTKSNGR